MAAVIIKRNSSIFFSSDPTVGALNVSQNGSVFNINLTSPIAIPKGAVSCDIAVISASIPYVNPNISADLKNDQFRFTTSEAPAGTFTISIPKGLYSLEALNNILSNSFVNLGHSPNLLVLTGDDATQSTVITFLLSGDSVDFTIANSVRTVLGFDSAVYTAPSAGFNQYSPNPAQFNSDTQYLISSNLVTNGVPINSVGVGILTNVPITATPGSIIVYQPNNLLWVDAAELIGANKAQLTFRVTNQNLVPIDTLTDKWSFTLMFKWSLLLTSESVPLNP